MTKISKNGVVKDMTPEEEIEHEEWIISSNISKKKNKELLDKHTSLKNSGHQKLKNLGLTDDEIKALMGA